MSSSNSPCAACKFLRRKCTQGCVFAPYFPPDDRKKFECVHRVFGASNVAKLLNELTPAQREDTVNSLAYEADMRQKDPVYGCVSTISMLQHQLLIIQRDLTSAKRELANLIGSAACGPISLLHPYQSAVSQPTMAVSLGMEMGLSLNGRQTAPASMGPLTYTDPLHQNHQEQQLMEVQNLADFVSAAREQDILWRRGQQLDMGTMFRDGSAVVGIAGSAAASLPLTLVSPQIGGFVMQQQQHLQGLKQQHPGLFSEDLGQYIHHNHPHSRGSHERSGVGPSS